MKNLWLIPASNDEAFSNIPKTLSHPISADRLKKAGIEQDGHDYYAWWAKSGKNDINVGKWAKMEAGDFCLFYCPDLDHRLKAYHWSAKIVKTERSDILSEAFWDNPVFDLVYFLEEPFKINIAVHSLSAAFNKYKASYMNNPPMGFMKVDLDVTKNIIQDHGSIESWINTIQEKKPPEDIPPTVEFIESYLEIQKRIKEWSDGFVNDHPAALDVASLTRHWYYSPIYDTFGPSKFIGYSHFSLDGYTPKKLDGKDTESAIKRLKEYSVLTDQNPNFEIYQKKLLKLLSLKDKVSNTKSQIHISEDGSIIRGLMFRLHQANEVFSYKYVMLKALLDNIESPEKSVHEYFWMFYKDRKSKGLLLETKGSSIFNTDFDVFKRSEIGSILDAPFEAINNCSPGDPVIIRENAEYHFNENIIEELDEHAQEVKEFIKFKLDTYYKQPNVGSLRVWWVNQGKTFRKEREAGYIWAPKTNEKGQTFPHWKSMSKVAAGDVVINYANKKIVSISIAIEKATDHKNEINEKLWDREGLKIPLDYHDLRLPIGLQEIQPLMPSINETIKTNKPFNTVNGINQGYLYNFSQEGIRKIIAEFQDRIPDKILDMLKRGPQLDFVTYLKNQGYYFSPELINRFVISLRAKPFVILTGNSGTGKTKIAQLFSEYLSPEKFETEIVIPDNDETGTYFKVGKATLKYGVTLPVDSLEYFNIPEIGKPTEVLIHFGGQSEKEYFATFGMPDNTEKFSNATIRFRKVLKKYVNENFIIGDYLKLSKVGEKEYTLEKVELSRVPSSEKLTNYALVPVGANWTDKRHLVGFNNVITQEYQLTACLKLILDASKPENEEFPFFLILDEMNLSHVERYFADFLSAMESDDCIYLHDSPDIEEEEGIPRKLYLPPNLYVLGTVNVDETTYMFSPKVLDRANVIEFPTVSARMYLNGDLTMENGNKDLSFTGNGSVRKIPPLEIFKTMGNITISDARTNQFANKISYEIETFQRTLKQIGFDFGFRVINEMMRYMYIAWEVDGKPRSWNEWVQAFDAQILHKILPKIHGSAKEIRDVLKCLYCLCFSGKSSAQVEKLVKGEVVSELYQKPYIEARYKESAHKLKRMELDLETRRYVSFT